MASAVCADESRRSERKRPEGSPCRGAYRDFTLKVVPDDARYGEYGGKVKARGETIEKQVVLTGRIGILNVETAPYCEADSAGHFGVGNTMAMPARGDRQKGVITIARAELAAGIRGMTL